MGKGNSTGYGTTKRRTITNLQIISKRYAIDKNSTNPTSTTAAFFRSYGKIE